MIEFRCPGCNQLLRAGETHSGALVGCARCNQHVQVPTARQSGSVPDVLPATGNGDPFAFQGAPSYRDDGTVDEDRGAYPNCPHCRCPGRADKVWYTWWGGFVGPMIFSLVRCRRCRACYNGTTGQKTDTAVAIYIGVSLGLVGMVIICGGIARIH